MPLGWYLAQGLYPIGPSSSDDEEGPCELPNGQIVCGPHGLVVCGKCCTDYSFMSSSSDKDDYDDDDDSPMNNPPINKDGDPGAPHSLGPEMRIGGGRVIPERFTPPTTSIMPTELFRGQKTYFGLTR